MLILMLLLTKPSVTDVRDARQGLGLTPELATEVLGLASWKNAEKDKGKGGLSTLDPYKWCSFQLITGLHKTLFLFDRIQGGRHILNFKDPVHRALLRAELERPKSAVLREARLRVGLTQSEMAKLAGMGQVSWARLESGSPVKRYAADGQISNGPPTQMDPYRWEILKLILGVHGKWELRRQDFPDQAIPSSLFFTKVPNERSFYNTPHNDAGGHGSHRGDVQHIGDVDHQRGNNNQLLSDDLPGSVLIEPTPQMQSEAIGLILEAIKEAGLKLGDVVAILKAGPGTVARNLTATQAQAVQDIRDTMDDNGLGPERLLKRRAHKEYDGRFGARPMLFQNPKNADEKWAGRGPFPHWLKAVKADLASQGKDPQNLAAYRIQPEKKP